MLAICFLAGLPVSSGKTDFSHRSLTQIPKNISHEETVLDLSNNQLAILGTHVFISLTNLKTLILNYNELTVINPGAFAGLKKLLTLELSVNKLESIPNLSSISTLQNFKINGNPIQIISYEDLQMLSHLYTLYVAWTRVNHFPALPYNPNKKTLYLRGNSIRKYPEQIFKRLPSLTQIYLGYNKLSAFPEFGDCSEKLTYLCMEYNRICSVPDLLRYKSLGYLDLSHNYVSAVPEVASIMLADGTVKLDTNPIHCMKELCWLTNDNPPVKITVTCLEGGRWQEFSRDHLCEGTYVRSGE